MVKWKVGKEREDVKRGRWEGGRDLLKPGLSGELVEGIKRGVVVGGVNGVHLEHGGL